MNLNPKPTFYKPPPDCFVTTGVPWSHNNANARSAFGPLHALIRPRILLPTRSLLLSSRAIPRRDQINQCSSGRISAKNFPSQPLLTGSSTAAVSPVPVSLRQGCVEPIGRGFGRLRVGGASVGDAFGVLKSTRVVGEVREPA